MNLRATKFFFAVTALLSGVALIVALFAQHVLYLQPCAWCILQRVIFLIIFVISILGWGLAFLRTPMMLLSIIVGALGAATAIYQLTVASSSFSCDLTLADRLITGSGLDQWAPAFFGVYANCSEAHVHFLGLPFSGWGLILYSFITLMAIWVWPVRNRQQHNQG